jgi:hypothetical protein
MNKLWMAMAGVLALGSTAVAQTNDKKCADPCRACMTQIQGTGSAGDDACPNACSACDKARSEKAKASQSSAAAREGKDVRTGLDQTASSVSSAVQGAASDVRQQIGQAQDRGIQGVGMRRNTLVTDAIGAFTGEGVNAQYQRPLSEKISGVLGGHFSRTNTVGGSATSFGAEAGADYFVLGGYNQGLRIGPRAGVNFGGISANDDTNISTRLGLGAELGYNWIGNSGLSAQLAGGLGGRVGTSVGGLDDRLGGDFGPYVRANLGWSW